MKRIEFFMALLWFGVACTEPPEPKTPDPVQTEMDSLIAVYGNFIATPNLTNLHYFQKENRGSSLIYGGTSDSFWFGIFGPDRSLLKEHNLNLNPENEIVDPVSYPTEITYKAMDHTYTRKSSKC